MPQSAGALGTGTRVVPIPMLWDPYGIPIGFIEIWHPTELNETDEIEALKTWVKAFNWQQEDNDDQEAADWSMEVLLNLIKNDSQVHRGALLDQINIINLVIKEVSLNAISKKFGWRIVFDLERNNN